MLGVPVGIQSAFQYPVEAVRNEQQGWVQFRYDVSEGRVSNVEVVASSPKGVFEQAVLDGATKLRFDSRKNAKGCLMVYEFGLGTFPGGLTPPSSGRAMSHW
jgi:TonB family protein